MTSSDKDFLRELNAKNKEFLKELLIGIHTLWVDKMRDQDSLNKLTSTLEREFEEQLAGLEKEVDKNTVAITGELGRHTGLTEVNKDQDKDLAWLKMKVNDILANEKSKAKTDEKIERVKESFFKKHHVVERAAEGGVILAILEAIEYLKSI